MNSESGKLYFYYSSEKNQFLKTVRGISFEEVELAIEEGMVLDIIAHPNAAKYPNQKIYVLNIDNYVHLVPFVKKSEHEIFLKTIFPSRKLTKKYLSSVVLEKSGVNYEQTKVKKKKKQ